MVSMADGVAMLNRSLPDVAAIAVRSVRELKAACATWRADAKREEGRERKPARRLSASRRSAFSSCRAILLSSPSGATCFLGCQLLRITTKRLASLW